MQTDLLSVNFIAFGRPVVKSGIAAIALFATAVAGQSPRTIRYPAVPPNAIVSLAKPSLTIASADCEFNGITGVVMQQRGGIVVANNGEQQLCYYDGHGAFLKRAGRKGAGPGEFIVVENPMLYRGDSIVVGDRMQRRVSVFGPAGEPGRQFIIEPPDTSLGSYVTDLALLSGDILLSFWEKRLATARPDPVIFYQQFVRAAPAGATATRVLRIVESEHFIQALQPEDRMGSTAYWNLQFGRSSSISATAKGFIAGDGGDNTLTEYDPAGKPIALHVTPLVRKPVTPEVIARYKRAELSMTKPERLATIQRLVDQMPYPKEMPAYNAVIADHAGPIWVQSYPDSTGFYWLRLDPASASTKAFKFPAKFRLYAVRADRACGVGRDDDDLQTIYCFTVPK